MARVSPVVGDASLAGSNEPCLNATRHVMPCCSPSHHEYQGVEEVLFVPPVNGQVLAYVGLDDGPNSAIFFLGQGCVGSSLYG